MGKVSLILFFFLVANVTFAQRPSPENVKKLKALAAELDSLRKLDEVRIAAFEQQSQRSRQSAKGIISGFRPNGKPYYTIDHNQGAATASRITDLRPGGRLAQSLTGKGMTVGIWENGRPIPTHQEFEDRLIIMDAASEVRTHASHVAGTVIGAGINAEARGMAYEATVHMYSAEGYLIEIAEAATEGLLVSNHSYGKSAGWSDGEWLGDTNISSSEDWAFGIYNSESATLDQVAFLAPYYLLIRSAGNENGEDGAGLFPPDGPYDCMTGEAIAKNILSIGNVNPSIPVPQDGDDFELRSSSSWGPADDGRIKPDLVAAGVSLLSASSDGDDQYTTLSGTSMSSPVTAGTAILLQQLHEQLFGDFMRSATLKGIMLHTAISGGSSPGPDYSHGYGFIDANLAARTINERDLLTIVDERTLTDQSSYQITFEVTDAGSPLIVSISWTDPAGTPITEAVLDPTDLNLVNDLDLRVTAPGGGTFDPWILNPANPSQAATTGDNFRDNYEKIEIETPVTGIYTINVTHKGSLENGSQDYSLIVTNLPRNDHRNTFYWIGESGNWNSPSEWSDESGGATISQVPSSDDRVVFDDNSFSASRVVDLTGDVSVHQISWLANNGSRINFNGNVLNISQNLVLEGNMTNTSSTIKINPVNNTTGSALINIQNDDLILDLDNPSSEFIISGVDISLRELKLTDGDLRVIDDFHAESIDLTSTNPKRIQLDDLRIQTSELDLGDLSTVNDLTLLDSEIHFDDGNGQHRISSSTPFDIPEVILQSGRLTIQSTGTIDAISILPGAELWISDQRELTVEDIQIDANESQKVGLSSVSGTATIFSDSPSKFCFDHIDITNVNVAGDAKFVYESNSTQSGSSGWIDAQCEDVLFAGFDVRSLCANNTTFFEDLSDGSPETWEWNFGDGGTSSDQNPNHSYSSIGSYQVTLTVTQGSETSSYSDEIDVVASSLAQPEIVLQNNRLLTNSPGSFFQWFLDGQPLPGETNRLLSAQPGEGAYQVEAADENCVALSEPFVVLGVAAVLSRSIQYYPNPVSDFLRLSFSEVLSDVGVRIIGLGGKLMWHEDLNALSENEFIEIPFAGFRKGIYILEVNVQGDRILNQKIVKAE